MRKKPRVVRATRFCDQRLELDDPSQSRMEMRTAKQTVTVVVRILWDVAFT